MRTISNKISIQSYLNLSQLLEKDRGTHEENRSFALEHPSLLHQPKKLIFPWIKRHLSKLEETQKEKKILEQLSIAGGILGFVSLLFGFLTGLGLLSYSGEAPVNILYYLFFALCLPLFSMSLTLVSIFSNGKILFTFFYWIEKLILLSKFGSKLNGLNEKIPPDIKKWIVIQRTQLYSLFFSIGLLVALLLIVVSRDIAFAWSTTLSIEPISFHAFLESVALPWSSFCPSCVPSVSLVEISQYYRLGGTLHSDILQHSEGLGEWWRFLAMATFIYAVLLRLLFWLLSTYGLNRALKRAFYSIDGVNKLIREFSSPYVSTSANSRENHLEIREDANVQSTIFKNKRYQVTLAWNFSNEEMALIQDNKRIETKELYITGGNNSFNEDQEIAEKIKGKILLCVKAWEPPTMDFMDFLEFLIDNPQIEEIDMYPLGLAQHYYKAQKREVEIWKRKIESIESQKIWMIDENE